MGAFSSLAALPRQANKRANGASSRPQSDRLGYAPGILFSRLTYYNGLQPVEPALLGNHSPQAQSSVWRLQCDATPYFLLVVCYCC